MTGFASDTFGELLLEGGGCGIVSIVLGRLKDGTVGKLAGANNNTHRIIDLAKHVRRRKAGGVAVRPDPESWLPTPRLLRGANNDGPKDWAALVL